MPVTKALPYEWYDTPNIRVGTYADFEVLARKDGLRILDTFGIQDGAVGAPLAEPARQRGGVQVRAGLRGDRNRRILARSPRNHAGAARDDPFELVAARRLLIARRGPGRRPAGQDPGAGLLPHDARRLRGHRAVRRHGRAARRQAAAPTRRRPRSRRRWRAASSKPPLETSVNGYLVNTGSKLVLIDTGAGGAVRPDAGQAGRQPEGRGLPARAGRRDLHHPHARRPRRRPGGRRQDGVPQRHRARRPGATPTSGSAPPTWRRRRGCARASSRARRRRSTPTSPPASFKPFDGDTELVPGIKAIADARPHAGPHASTWSRARARSWCCGAT